LCVKSFAMNETKRGPKPRPRAIQAWQTQRDFLSPGTLRDLAAALRVTGPAVSKWPYVPRRRVRDVATFLGLQPHDLRPDLYQPDPWTTLKGH